MTEPVAGVENQQTAVDSQNLSSPCCMSKVSKMEITKVFVESENGIPSNEAFYKAWEGFRKRRFDCELFEAKQIGNSISLSRQTLVAGGLRVVEAAMNVIGMTVPEADNLPERLRAYRGRKIESSTWGELRAKYAESGPRQPLFVKPLSRNKAFPSIALYNSDDLVSLGHLPDTHEVLVAEYVLFRSEWRCFVCRGQVIEISHYQGEMFCYPDASVIQNAIDDFGSDAPAGYAIDFGVLDDGRTVLVEVNPGYSLGSYGMNSVEYSELLEARWLELAEQ